MKLMAKMYVFMSIGCRYQVRVLELLQKAASGKGSQDINVECQFTKIYSPRGVDLYRDTEFASEAALWGIEVGS